MSINFEKVSGWVILFAGLALIVYSARTSYGYFTGESQFPALVQTAAKSVEPEDNADNSKNIDLADSRAVREMMQIQVQTSVDKTVNSMIPDGSIVKMLNAAIWSIFATFLVYAGAKISEIGVKLLVAKPQN